jgi:hypothetical protein
LTDFLTIEVEMFSDESVFVGEWRAEDAYIVGLWVGKLESVR